MNSTNNKNYNKILNYALTLLSQRMYTEVKLIFKLRSKNKDSSEEIADVIKRLKEWKYINDLDYAIAYIQKLTTINNYGKYYIIQKLKILGISGENISQAFKKVKIDEESVAMRAFNKIVKNIKKYPLQKRKQKIAYHLQSKGFGSEIVYRLLAEKCV